jgi:hypothetical protein
MRAHYILPNHHYSQDLLEELLCLVINIILIDLFYSGNFWGGLESSMKWNMAIRAYMESFLELNLAAFINLSAVIIYPLFILYT